MKKSILYIILLIAIIAIFADRIGFNETVDINGLTWMTNNAGADDARLIGEKYTFEQALKACPEGYRLPTKAEMEALSRNYSSPVYYYDVIGRWFTGKERYSQSAPAIFLPRSYVNSRFDTGSYWTSTSYDRGNGYALLFNAKNVNVSYIGKENKLAVRCVKCQENK